MKITAEKEILTGELINEFSEKVQMQGWRCDSPKQWVLIDLIAGTCITWHEDGSGWGKATPKVRAAFEKTFNSMRKRKETGDERRKRRLLREATKLSIEDLQSLIEEKVKKEAVKLIEAKKESENG